MNKEEILEAIDNMSVKELAELVTAIEERYKVSAAAAVPTIVQAAGVTSPATGTGAGAGAAVAEKTTLKVVLKNPGQQKVPLIKKIKEITGKGLKECKELVDNLPGLIKEGIEEEEAKRIKTQLEELGAEVELQ